MKTIEELKRSISLSSMIHPHLQEVFDGIFDHIAALESPKASGEHYPWTCPICMREMDFSDYYDHLKDHRPKNDAPNRVDGESSPQPTPAPKVETFKAYELIGQIERTSVGDKLYRKEPIGDVVATTEIDHSVLVRLPNKTGIVFDEYRDYTAFVDHQLESGMWERQA